MKIMANYPPNNNPTITITIAQIHKIIKMATKIKLFVRHSVVAIMLGLHLISHHWNIIIMLIEKDKGNRNYWNNCRKYLIKKCIGR